MPKGVPNKKGKRGGGLNLAKLAQLMARLDDAQLQELNNLVVAQRNVDEAQAALTALVGSKPARKQQRKPRAEKAAPAAAPSKGKSRPGVVKESPKAKKARKLAEALED